jgi:GH25 family lysozyme M1 (1,4-beta-N-acetylmuramidase)
MTCLGYDLSKWQAGAYSGGGGFTFGLAKASEGNGYADPTYGRHLTAIKAHGLVPGAYHFARPDLGNSPEAEADWFLRVVGDPRGLLLALDLEVGSGSLGGWRDRFCDRVQGRVGRPCWWYSYSNFVNTRGLNTAGADYPFWLAWPDANGALPRFSFGGVSMQQYGLTGVPGISGDVDANRFFGSLDQLRRLTVGGAEEDMTPDQDAKLTGLYNGWFAHDRKLDAIAKAAGVNLAAIQAVGTPVVDVAALAAALAPHLADVVDEGQLATDLAPHLGEDVAAALAKRLAGGAATG